MHDITVTRMLSVLYSFVSGKRCNLPIDNTDRKLNKTARIAKSKRNENKKYTMFSTTRAIRQFPSSLTTVIKKAKKCLKLRTLA